MIDLALWAVLGYLSGSVSFAWILSRLRGMDLRRYGSRKLSSSNVYQFQGVSGLVIVGILDVAKAALPAWLALAYGPGIGGAVAAGLGATAGHNWSVYLGFKGGRGVSTALGMFLMVFWPAVPWVLGWLILGRLWPTRAALVGYLGILLLPAWASALEGGAPAQWACTGFLTLTTLKRLEGNREPLPQGESWGAVLWRRLWLDRDVADFESWATRRPSSDDGVNTVA